MPEKNKLRNFWTIYRQKKTAVFGLIVVVIFIAGVIFAPQIAPYNPKDIVGAAFESPSLKHYFGTNDIGVDVFSEVIYAGRISITVGLIAASIIIFSGSIIGMLAGYFGGYVDEILMRITDCVLALPRLPLMIVMGAYIGPGMWSIIFVYSSVGWASVARQIRAQVMLVRQYSFIEAARSIGAGDFHTLLSHVLPNVMGIIIANGVMEIMFAILTEAGLSFLGLGDPAHESWGVMLYFAQNRGAFLMGAWWWIFAPGLAIALLSCAFNFIGTALSDLFGLKLEKNAAST